MQFDRLDNVLRQTTRLIRGSIIVSKQLGNVKNTDLMVPENRVGVIR